MAVVRVFSGNRAWSSCGAERFVEQSGYNADLDRLVSSIGERLSVY
jgi:hypothetical protein